MFSTLYYCDSVYKDSEVSSHETITELRVSISPLLVVVDAFEVP